MGIIGEAYVDKEKAFTQLIAAKKNIQEVQAIIKTANDLNVSLSTAINGAVIALNSATNVYGHLVDEIESITDKSSVKYAKLVKLLLDLNETSINDTTHTDNCNISIANRNKSTLESLTEKINKVISDAKELLENNKLNAIVRCQEYNIAKEIFESMVVDSALTIEELSDSIESTLAGRIRAIQNVIDYGNIVNNEISTVSNNVEEEIRRILNGDDESEEDTPVSENEYWYAGYKAPESDETFTAIDGPLTANHWFNMPKTMTDSLIAGVNGNNLSAEYWYVALPAGKYVPQKPVLPEDGDHTVDGHEDTSENNVYDETENPNGYEKLTETINIDDVEYDIWRTKVTIYNKQRLNVYFKISDDYVAPLPAYGIIIGEATEESIRNSFNGANKKKPSKPIVIDSKKQYNIERPTESTFVVPESWGTPVIIDSNDLPVGLDDAVLITVDDVNYNTFGWEIGVDVFTITFN